MSARSQLIRWRERALTLKIKSEELQRQMMVALSEEDYATTMGDNLVIAAEDMLNHLDQRLEQSQ